MERRGRHGWLLHDEKSEYIRKFVAGRIASGKQGLRIHIGELIIEPSYCEEARDIIRQLPIEVYEGIP